MLKLKRPLIYGWQECKTTLEDSLAIFYKVKHTLLQLDNFTSKYLSKRSENVCPHGTLHMMFVAASLIIANS